MLRYWMPTGCGRRLKSTQGKSEGGFGAGRSGSGQTASQPSDSLGNMPLYGDDGTLLAPNTPAQGQNTLPYDFGDDGTVLSQDKLAKYGTRGYDETIWEDNPVRKAIRQVALGRYTDESTPLGNVLQILAGLSGLDNVGDVRDLFYDLTHWENTPAHQWQTVQDLFGVLPLIGAVKNADEAAELAQGVLRYGNELSDAIQALSSGTDEAAKFLGTAAKYSDEAGELAQGVLKNEDEVDAIIRQVFDEEDEIGKTLRNTLDDENDWLEAVTEGAGDGGKSFADVIIRDGSQLENGKLKPNVTYQSGEYDYIYNTNEDGLITNAHTDSLQIKNHSGRLNHNPNTYEKVEGDQAGHLFGDRFGGSPELDNLVSQAKRVNQSEFKILENHWASALKNRQQVAVDITINYANGGVWPVSFDVSYTLDGVPFFSSISN